MVKQQLVIDGNNFSDLNGFFDEVEVKLTFGLDWKIGRNLNAFNDLLRGGFGRHEYEEPIQLEWVNWKKSRADLDLFDDIILIIKTHDHIDLYLS
ncbi:MAG: barstar family protein [Sediminibacterium sp.]|jgi:RNAse (barnase) inhibitor barstar|nr:barstar family protein [Chitinophagaceae bacterium]MCA6446607.1 barstar family protein [Chitinophagaceae bacterium]